MEEAALLPPESPLRQRVEEEVARAGPWAETEWLDLLRFDERMRIALRQMEVSAGLKDRLLAIPHVAQPARALSWSRAAVAAAGALTLAAAGWMAGRAPPSRPEAGPPAASGRLPAEADRALHTLALLAMQEHMNESDLVVRTGRADELRDALGAHLPFPVHVPDLGPGYALLGGRPCHLGGHLVALTLWRAPAGTVSLYQFRSADFDLAAIPGPRLVRPHGPAAGHRPCEVRFWTEGDRGFALVFPQRKA
jgi:hypothetical protein